MTNTPYTGQTPIAPALARLYGFNSKNTHKIKKLMKMARDALGIPESKNPPVSDRVAIYQYHCDRLGQLNRNTDTVEIDSQAELFPPVDIISQSGQDEPIEYVELFSQAAQPEPVDIISHDGRQQDVETASPYGIDDVVRIAFYTTSQGIKKRQVIALDGFYINALIHATGIGKPAVPKWVQQAVDSWADFDSQLPITRQVKLLLILELMRHVPRHAPVS